MSNDNKQTSVEWYAQRLYDLEIAYNQGVIETDIYIKSKIEAKQQAKEMEKEQMIDFAIKCMFNSNDIGSNLRNHFIQKYNTTYGGNK